MVHKEDFTIVLALIAITVTSSSDKHHKEPMILYLSLSLFIMSVYLHIVYFKN